MLLFNKPLTQINEQDLQSLIEDQRPEDRNLEYKQQVYREAPTEKVNFCTDVCSLANTAGGQIVLGIKELAGKKGLPEKVIGFEVSPDQERLRLEAIIRSG